MIDTTSAVLDRWGGVLLTTAVATPVAALVVWAQAARRGWRNPALEAVLVLGTLPWLWMVLTPRGTGRALDLVPFADLAGQLGAASAVEQIGGNLLVFAALGAAAPLRWPLGWRVVAIAAAGSVAIEVAQYVLAIGRVSSADDVLLNVAGAALAAAASRHWWRAGWARAGHR
ncbi:VanZ family protein [Pseudonocardia sp. CA-107938]|uniref:VanZ family protein n=1 Tax=Pseudonocardia sp. CA-107938 TaxID=3240021 RepID=UPI003D89B0E1